MEKSIFKYILKHSLRGQIVLLAVTAVSMPFVYFSLDVPKTIVNQAIGGEGLPASVFGMDMDQVTYLFALCLLFLLLVLINGGFKYYLNVYRGVLGERMLRRLRYELYQRLLRFPLPHFKRVSSGEIIPMLTAETEPLGGFIGEAYSLPAFQGGLLLTYLFFIFNQDPLLGAAATALYPFQLYVIPKLQRRVNQLAKQRVLTARQLANRIGESVAGMTEIHANDTSHFERADIAERLGKIFEIRFQIYRKKFFIKFLNNFLAQVTPFFFYSAGGYFVIKGELSLGALVAVLAAYKDLATPWNELLKFYQTMEDVRVKYAQIIEQFDPQQILDAELLDQRPAEVPPLTGELIAGNVSFSEDQLIRLVDGANLQMRMDEHMLVLGGNGSGRDELGRLLARLVLPTGGRLSIGEHNAGELPEAVTGRRIGYVGQNAYLRTGSVRDNLYYALKHVPREATDGEPDGERAHRLTEARLSGNSPHDPAADWIDYAAAGVDDAAALQARVIELLSVVGLEEDIYQMGLRSTVDPAARASLAASILEARRGLQAQLAADPKLAELVEPFDQARYNLNATVAENLLFGTPRSADLDLDQLATDPYIAATLGPEFTAELLEIGRKVAETMVDLFADLPPGHEFFEQFSFISAEDLPEFQQMLARIGSQGMEALQPDARARLLSLAFKLIPTRHRLGLIDEGVQARTLAAREALRADPPAEFRAKVSFFRADEYNAETTLLDNILFGKLAYGHAHGQAQLNALVNSVITQFGLRNAVLEVGLDYEVGIAGGRLSMEQRQKIALARALLKRPDLTVVNDATSALDSGQELELLRRVREYCAGRALVWLSGREDLAGEFDRVVVMENGKIAEREAS